MRSGKTSENTRVNRKVSQLVEVRVQSKGEAWAERKAEGWGGWKGLSMAQMMAQGTAQTKE